MRRSRNAAWSASRYSISASRLLIFFAFLFNAETLVDIERLLAMLPSTA